MHWHDEVERTWPSHLFYNVERHCGCPGNRPQTVVRDDVGRPLLHQAGAHDLDGRYDDERGQAMSSTRRRRSRCVEEGCGKNVLDFCMNTCRMIQVDGFS